MKRSICIFLILCIFASFCACAQDSASDPVRFFYLRSPDHFRYGSAEGVVTYEERDASGHTGDVKYLLTLYLQGPADEMLHSPFPSGLKIVELSRRENEMYITLNSRFQSLKGMDQTLACVCLARTGLSLVDVQTVHIQVSSDEGQTSLVKSISVDSLLLVDTEADEE